MFKITSVILLSYAFSLLYASPAFATENFTFSIDSLSEFEVGQIPFVNGKAVSLDDSPVSDVLIQVHFPSGTINTTTNNVQGRKPCTLFVPPRSKEEIHERINRAATTCIGAGQLYQ